MNKKSTAGVCVFCLLSIAGYFAFADTEKTADQLITEQTITARIENLQEVKTKFTADVNDVLLNVAGPMIGAVEALIEEAQAINDMAVTYAASIDADPNQTAAALGVVQAYCDAESIASKRQTLSMLKAIIEIAREEFTK